ncbi:MAG: flagellar motor protein MotB [Pseudomonadota bacterium]
MADQRPIIVKKVVKGGDGHHGGAWKVAYADFVTAMMAFFLLMWLLNSTSEDQLAGLADYFDPSIPISRNSAGGAGMLAGDTIFTQKTVAGSQPDGQRAKPTRDEPGDTEGEEDDLANPVSDPDATEDPSEAAPPTRDGQAERDADGEIDTTTAATEEAEARVAAEAQAALEALQTELTAVVEGAADNTVARHLQFQVTPEGLVIEVVDLVGEPLFGAGSAAPAPLMSAILDVLVPVLNDTTNDIAIVGHTDASPFGAGGQYTNWELSSDRAQAVRRMMGDGGLPPTRIKRVSGRAATSPLSDDPLAPQNRRIAITLLRDSLR